MEPMVNVNNVFITLRTEPQFNFSSDQEMRSFIKAEYESETTPASTFCVQKSDNLSLFECLIVYPAGIPPSEFTISFHYETEKNGNTIRRDLDVEVEIPQIISSMYNIRRVP